MFTLQELKYEKNALEPVISEETVTFHHDKHHQAYVDNLNKAVDGTDCAKAEKPEDLLKDLDAIPADIRQAVINNGGGVYNHNLYWDQMVPGGATEPQGALKEAIDKEFGSFDEFKKAFEEAGKSRFGSGWAWLVKDGDAVKVVSTANQDNPISEGQIPLLGNDVWEHAYYLDYQNKRPDYLSNYWKVVNWDVVGERFDCK